MSEAVRKDNISRPTATEARWLIGIVACATALRIAMLLLRGGDLHTDPDVYVALAKTVESSGGFSSPGTAVPTAFRPPLYPLTLAVLMSAGLKTSMAIACVALLAGVAVTIATWWMSQICGLRSVWCGLTAFFAGVDPLLLRYSSLPMTETLSAALLTVGVLQMLKLLPASEDSDGRLTASPIKSAAVAGLCFGLAGLCRPICFLTCGVLAFGLLISSAVHRKRDHSCRVRLATALVPVLTAGLVLMPWVIRNAVQFHDFIPLTTHGGYTLLLGNNKVFYRDVVKAPGQPVWSEESLTAWQNALNEELASAGLVTETEQDTWMYARAKQAIRDDPSTFRKACLLRWKRFWAVQPRVTGSVVPGWIVWCVGVWYLLQWTGLAASLLFLRRHRIVPMLWLAVGSFLLLHSFYWTNTRMRAPLAGVIVVLAALGWQHLFEFIHTRKKLKT